MEELDEDYWFVMEQVYELHVDLPIDPPPIDEAKLMSHFGSGTVTAEEVIRNARLNLGLNLDVLDDPEFMAQAMKKLDSKHDTETQLKMQQKYAVKKDGASGSGAKKPAKKRKAEGGGGKDKSSKKKAKK
jgi:ribosomal protein S13